MTKKERTIFFIIIIIAFFLREEIYGFFYRDMVNKEVKETVASIKEETLLKKEEELISNYGYIDTVPYHLEPTKILYRDIYNLENHITIYKGNQNQIKEKNLVINELGLVGIVSKVNKNSSEVELLIHSDLNLSVKVGEYYGILKYQNKELIVEGINNKSAVEVGMEVKTSDISIYPENILIGTVNAIESDSYEIEKKLKVTPEVRFEDLKYLSIITDFRGEE